MSGGSRRRVRRQGFEVARGPGDATSAGVAEREDAEGVALGVQGVDVRPDDTEPDGVELTRYRDMMQRLARDPVGRTRVFELLMRLFFIYVLGVRPESLQNRRHARGEAPREWCTDGVAASSCAPGIMGPVLAFRGELEA